ncbi:MAG: monovalent cation/H(+) antiporter subunit G [Defluviitaleaceae bacterium]|nr:monovalent cation/H(+) antiporter subunit G [Defluviitaleaceae bacterium]
MIILSYVVMGIALILMAVGLLGLFKFKNFYPRLLVSTKIDTVGVMVFILGIAIRHGFSFFSAKSILLILIIVVLNPLMSHFLSKGAYLSGLRPENHSKNKDKQEVIK